MRILLVAFSLACLPHMGAVAADRVDATIHSLGVFKNGIALVERSFDVSSEGTFYIEEEIIPVHGAVWIGSEAEVDMRLDDVPFPYEPPRSYTLNDLVGKKIHIRLRRNDLGPTRSDLMGVVEGPAPSPPFGSSYADLFGDNSMWPTTPDLSGRNARTGPGMSQFLILRTDEGSVWIPKDDIGLIVVTDDDNPEAEPLTVDRKRLHFDVRGVPRSGATVTLTYLTRGAAWAPWYEVILDSGDELSFVQYAAVRNELESIDDAEIRLITGFPNIQFQNTRSLLAAPISLATFFQELSNASVGRGDLTTNRLAMAQIAGGMGGGGGAGGARPLPLPEFEAESDIQYSTAPVRSLDRGDVWSAALGHATTEYERIVLWEFDDRQGQQNRRSFPQPIPEPSELSTATWDAIRFDNPLGAPLTTGPVSVREEHYFLGQSLLSWTRSGGRAVIRITQALGIETEATETVIEQFPANPNNPRGSMRTRYLAKMRIANPRTEDVTVVITRHFIGTYEGMESDHDADITSRAPAAPSWGDDPNVDNTLEVEVEVPAGGEEVVEFLFVH